MIYSLCAPVFTWLVVGGVNKVSVLRSMSTVAVCISVWLLWFNSRTELLRLISGESLNCVAKSYIMPLEGTSPFS